MAKEEAARQFSFRLPEGLAQRVELCRFVLKHALDATQCKIDLLLGSKTSKNRTRST
jgi:hypothetical protein